MKPNIGLSDKQREGVVQILAALLADEYVLYTKTRNCHWNVVGPQSNDLHKFFGSQYNDLNEVVDEVAERGRSLGGSAIGTLTEFLTLARLKERPKHYPAAREMITGLLHDHEAIIRSLRVDLETTADRGHEAGSTDSLGCFEESRRNVASPLPSFLEGKSA